MEFTSTHPGLPDAPPSGWRSAGLAYHSLNFFHNKRFGGRVWKVSLDAGCTCPNRDGTLATLGCIFCDPASFSPSRRQHLPSVADQLDEGIRRVTRRRRVERFLAYFQPGANTYGPIDRLAAAFHQAISHPQVVGIIVGTRPDCASEEALDLLADLAKRTWLVIEYGLQSVHDRTLDRLGRGHHFDAFLDAYRRTRQRNLNIGVHVILGLPGESRDDMLATARALAGLDLHSVKPHNLYAVRNTVLADEVVAGRIRLPEFDEYVGYLVDFLQELPERFVIERLCGDAPREYLIGPQWCLDKAAVRAAVEAEFRRRQTRQGCRAQ
ncbi:MAG: TIGR01212 family radical SAM protein [Thermoguttaceae bacterium]|jgi:radical SAM protein (TIGR01212 family)